MASGMLAAEAAGYPIIMTVHDEAVAEVPDDFGSVEDFERVLCTRDRWAADIPVVASGYAAKRYRKD
jgi:DNA polymerase